MKIHTGLALIAALVATSAYADTYECTANDTAGIFNLTVDPGTASLTVNGAVFTATGAGDEYYFDSAFTMGDVSFNTPPVLSLPTDGEMNDVTFDALLADDSGVVVHLNCMQ